MRGSTPDPTGVPPDGATLTSAHARPQVGPGNRDQGVTEPVCARAVLNPGLPERAVSAYSGRRNAPASDPSAIEGETVAGM